MSVGNLDQDVQFRTMSGEQRELLMIQVAKRYYELDMTMGDLAKELNLTRWQASRLLTEAREAGIVRIEIVPRAPRSPDIESRLQRRWNLKEAVVVPNNGEEDEGLLLDAVAQAAARMLAGLGKVPLIGVSWGRTMSAVAHRLPPFWNEGVEVVLLNGAMNIRSPSVRTNNTAELFARSANGTATLLPVPAILGHAATRIALEQDPTIASVLELARQAPVICFGMGTISPDSVLVQSGFVTEAETQALKAKGAVGDILSRYIDAQGNIVDADIDARTIGLDLRYCRERKFSIGVAAGKSKQPVTLACLRAGYVNVLVTDEETARFLLDESHHG
ncbi:sugar-binding transcriptional regulator [Labrys neptuniae]|jgi:deoxyribonucleoside regulator|uniref:sugar-binding transcriptional regulator n=1 Tax=Labrys TaxID=204476 RepID=UPI0009EDEFCD|nr:MULTISPECIES: sugar-binding transcriptional regulator [Labrys]MDT3380018.1 sugar-binding transcriptional regulator [Labrys neptuniae]MDZ5454081.1 sugar-binding transcriptional regulator [Labrys sp. ZIDIC5]